MSVAGGELLIPTIVLLDIKIAGSLSLLVSPPTMARPVCPLQPRRQLRRPAGQLPLHHDPGGGRPCRGTARRAAPRHRPDLVLIPALNLVRRNLTRRRMHGSGEARRLPGTGIIEPHQIQP
jgi:hypothetical protein